MHLIFKRGTRSVLLAVAVFTAVAAPAAHAATATSAVWSCEANAVIATIAGIDPLNPITSGPRAPCTDGTVGLPNTTNAIGLAPTINAKTAYAITSAKPAGAAPNKQSIGATAGVEGLSLTTGSGTVVIGVGAAQSQVIATCQNDKPVITGKSEVTELTINGQPISLDTLLSGIVDPISNSPLGDLVSVKLNEQVRVGDTLIQRAAHIKVLSGVGGTPLADVIIAESKAGSASACDPNALGNVSGSGTQTNGLQVCPTGATLDTTSGFCVITAENSGGQGVIVIGLPYTGPSGGSVLSLNLARKRYHSPCLQGPGPAYATIGTNKADHITGRNTADRILGLGGSDSLDGGRGNDCIDGGTGNDSMNGGIGNDRVYGVAGNDHLNGGPGNDRLSGGSGNDTINAGYGRDNVFGGPGVDFINVATAGPPAHVNCGTGKDKVRINKNETRRVNGCETQYIFRDR